MRTIAIDRLGVHIYIYVSVCHQYWDPDVYNVDSINNNQILL